ncbi:hypothetical protein FJ546_29025 [Mesorhizobium sp. B2-4-19]|uniref:hypothetical protein n=1 Tax=Mesorhizobium sp. B2-4-19 TaxID=2589930 RepID=UPI00112B8DCB|nr:hypothetical protein [Mesorhizobium sp. B2-4-19]TPK55860.1 hypothetical protein FJ546_29025 [Mesorhizobium sp. B2-4-19]
MTDFIRLKAKYPDLILTTMTFQCGAGWELVLDQYFSEVVRALPADTRLRVYQKYGSLRIDATAAGTVTPEIRLALDRAEILANSRSYRFCEACGKPGSLRDKQWLYVGCEDHADGAAALPPDEGGIRQDGVAYEYDEDADDLVVVQEEREGG